MTVGNSVLTHDTADFGDGGAIYNQDCAGGAPATLTVTDSSFSDDSVVGGYAGGAIANFGAASVSGSTFTCNTSHDWAGAVANFRHLAARDQQHVRRQHGRAVCRCHSELDVGDHHRHHLDRQQGDRRGWYRQRFRGTLKLGTTIVAKSTGGDCSLLGTVNDPGYNLDDDSTCNLHATTDLTGVAAGLDPTGLQENGGPTQTVALEPGKRGHRSCRRPLPVPGDGPAG